MGFTYLKCKGKFYPFGYTNNKKELASFAEQLYNGVPFVTTPILEKITYTGLRFVFDIKWPFYYIEDNKLLDKES